MRFKINEIGDDGLAVNVSGDGGVVGRRVPRSRCASRSGWAACSEGRSTRAVTTTCCAASCVGDLDTTCARCLEPARVHIDVPMTVTFVAAGTEDVDEEEDADPDVVDVHRAVRSTCRASCATSSCWRCRSTRSATKVAAASARCAAATATSSPALRRRRDADDARRPRRAGQDQALIPTETIERYVRWPSRSEDSRNHVQRSAARRS